MTARQSLRHTLYILLTFLTVNRIHTTFVTSAFCQIVFNGMVWYEWHGVVNVNLYSAIVH